MNDTPNRRGKRKTTDDFAEMVVSNGRRVSGLRGCEPAGETDSSHVEIVRIVVQYLRDANLK